MKHLRTIVALMFAAAIGSGLTLNAITPQAPSGMTTHRDSGSRVAPLQAPIAQLGGGAQPASAASLGVTLICIDAIQNFSQSQTPTNVTQHCIQSVNDTSGLANATLTFTAPTQRYPIGVSGTVTLP